MLNYFIPFGLNLIQGQDPLSAAKNAAISGTVGDIAGSFGSALPGAEASFGAVQNATNVPGLLTNSTGNLASTAANAGYTGATSMMQNLGTQAVAPSTSMMQTLSGQGQNVAENLGQQMTPAYKNINPALVSDASKIPAEQMYVDTLASKYRPQFESPQLGQSTDFTGGGYSPSIMGRIGEGIEKGIEFAKENPLLTGFGALAAYRGINPPERPVPPPSAGSISRGPAISLGQPLQVRRPR